MFASSAAPGRSVLMLRGPAGPHEPTLSSAAARSCSISNRFAQLGVVQWLRMRSERGARVGVTTSAVRSARL